MSSQQPIPKDIAHLGLWKNRPWLCLGLRVRTSSNCHAASFFLIPACAMLFLRDPPNSYCGVCSPCMQGTFTRENFNDNIYDWITGPITLVPFIDEAALKMDRKVFHSLNELCIAISIT